MDEFAEILTWLDRGERVVSATLIRTDGSTSHDAGATFFVSDRHAVAGAVSGGCVEAALFHEADAVFASGEPRVVTYGPEDESPFGLTCGGTIEVFVGLVDREAHATIVSALGARQPAVLATRLRAPFDAIAVSRDRLVGRCVPSGVDEAVKARIPFYGRLARMASRSEAKSAGSFISSRNRPCCISLAQSTLPGRLPSSPSCSAFVSS